MAGYVSVLLVTKRRVSSSSQKDYSFSTSFLYSYHIIMSSAQQQQQQQQQKHTEEQSKKNLAQLGALEEDDEFEEFAAEGRVCDMLIVINC